MWLQSRNEKKNPNKMWLQSLKEMGEYTLKKLGKNNNISPGIGTIQHDLGISYQGYKVFHGHFW